MEFPYGIGHPHHHRHPNEEEEHPPIYPPPGKRSFSPPHPHHHPHHHDIHGHHHHHESPNPSPFFPPPSFAPNVQHVAHETHQPHHQERPQPSPFFPSPSFAPNVQHVAHETHLPNHRHPSPSHHDHVVPPRPALLLPHGQDVRVFCEAETDYSLTIRGGSVVLAPCNPSDEFQHWIKDEKYSTKVKDEEGFPSFALVNKASGLALQHSIGGTQPVRVTPYRPDKFDQSILWTLSKDVGHGFRTIRMVNNIRLNLDAFNGDKNHGGVHDGTVAVLWEWKKGDNQRWKLVPY